MTKFSLLITAAAILFAASPASADITLSAQYYNVSYSDPDFNTNPCCSYVSYNEVGNSLVNGRPVYNPNYTTNAGAGTPLHDVAADGTLTWWSPSLNPNVTAAGSGTITLPFSSNAFFPPTGMGSGDGNSFLTAVFTGTINVPQTEAITFSFGSDDDAFIAINNTVVAQLGSIHGDTPGPVTTNVYTPGDYALTVFYADRHATGAAFDLNITTADITTVSGVPEPSTWAMMIFGFFGVGYMTYRHRNLPTSLQIV